MKLNTVKKELVYTFSKSSGPGGQHVNKVSSRVELRFDVLHSDGLSEREKSLIFNALPSRIVSDQYLVLTSQATRSQIKNKSLAEERLFKLLLKAIIPKKKRISTKPNKKSKEKRLKLKRIKSEVKSTRRKPDY